MDIHGLNLTVGHRVLLSEARLKLLPGRYGFIGANGTGKSSGTWSRHSVKTSG